MKHFLERLEREINYTNEYRKLERIICEEQFYSNYSGRITINEWIEKNFSKWKKRKAYTSFEEVREQCGFSYSDYFTPFDSYISMEKYIIYSEMVINLVFDLTENTKMPSGMAKRFTFVLNTIKANLAQIGCEIKDVGEEYIIVEKNAVAMEIADKVPELADSIIEYNHFLLKGDLEGKQVILKKISDALEPKRSILFQIDKSKTDDYFRLVNEMNVRHNNIDPQGGKNYNMYFANLSEEKQEEWYDLIYEQSLMLFMLLEQQKRTEKIKAYKEEKDKEK